MSDDFLAGIRECLGTILEISFDPVDALCGFASAAVLGVVIALVYKKTNGKEADRDITMQAFVLLSVAIAGSMMVVGNNLARAFGLVGAVSIIRFRTSVQNTRQMAFVFISIVAGMASGLGFYALGASFTFAAALCSLALSLSGFGRNDSHPFSFRLAVRWSLEYDIRQDIEAFLKEAGVEWRIESLEIKPGRKILVFVIAVPHGVEVYDFTFRLREALHLVDAKLSVSLLPFDPGQA